MKMFMSMLIVSLTATLSIVPGAISIRLIENLQSYNSDNVVFNVLDYGAKADAKTDDSKAFLEAWSAACSSTQPSTVYVPGEKYLLNPISFVGLCRNHITMQINGELIASTDNSLWSGSDQNYWLQFSDVNGLTVEGGGILDGRGASWWHKDNKKNPNLIGPTSLKFTSTMNTILRKITSINSKQFHINFDSCKNVEIDGLKIHAPADSPNTDGIHIGDSSNVTIRDIIIGTGDDCISVGSGSFNVAINGVRCGPGHGISVGSLGEDHSTAAVRNVTVSDVSLVGTMNGVRIKTWPGGNGFAKDLTFQNVNMRNVQNPVIIDQYYAPNGVSVEGESGVKISNVLYKNITGTSATKVAIDFACSGSVACDGIQVEDVHMTFINGGNAESSCKNAHVTATDVQDGIPLQCNQH